MATNLENYKMRSEMDKVKAAIIKHLPQHQGLVDELNGLNPKNNILINNLVDKWKNREPPSENVRDIIKNNIDYNSHADRRPDIEARGIDPNEYINEKRWILKEQNAWYRWDPRANEYGRGAKSIRTCELGSQKIFRIWHLHRKFLTKITPFLSIC